MKYTYTLENLNCAHCAGKIEAKIAQTDGYDKVSFNFATKKLSFYSDKSGTLGEIQSICDSIEDGVTVTDCDDSGSNKDKNSEKTELILIATAAALGAAALAVHLFAEGDAGFWLTLVLSAAATLLSGIKTFIKGIKNAVKLSIDENALMTVAVIAAFCLGEFVEGAMVSILFAIGEFIEDKAVDSSRRDIEKLSKIRPDTATLLKDGKERSVPAKDVPIGSVILVKPHERIPLDGTIIEGCSTLDNSALTGESIPVEAGEGDEVMSGAINGERALKIKTSKEFGDSTAARILRLVEEAAAQKGNREKLISRFASVYTPVVIIMAVLIAVFPPLIGLGAFRLWLYRALAVLVAACPCAIVISVPLAYYAGIGSASRAGVLIKGGKYLEALAKADSFAFDKTGTLTTGKLEIKKIHSCSQYSEKELLSLAAACEKYSSHPIAAAIKSTAGEITAELTDYSETAGSGTSAVYKGKALCCCGRKFVKDSIPQELENANVFITLDSHLLGAIEVGDSARNEAAKTIDSLKKLGVKRTVMLTGDSRFNAVKTANTVGISDMRYELMPSDKLDAVAELKKQSKAVCFVGDGINDAPVLNASDCGIAMGLGSEAAIEAGDAVLASDNLSSLPKAVKLARKAINTVRTNIAFSLSVKLLVIILAAAGITPMWLSVLADTGVCLICVLYTARLLKISE